MQGKGKKKSRPLASFITDIPISRCCWFWRSCRAWCRTVKCRNWGANCCHGGIGGVYGKPLATSLPTSHWVMPPPSFKWPSLPKWVDLQLTLLHSTSWATQLPHSHLYEVWNSTQHHPFNYLRALPDHHSPRMREDWSLLGACGGEICYTSWWASPHHPQCWDWDFKQLHLEAPHRESHHNLPQTSQYYNQPQTQWLSGGPPFLFIKI